MHSSSMYMVLHFNLFVKPKILRENDNYKNTVGISDGNKKNDLFFFFPPFKNGNSFPDTESKR